MKIKATFLTIFIITAFLSGCGNNNKAGNTPTPTNAATITPSLAPSVTPQDQTGNVSPTAAPGAVDVVTTASIVAEEAAFLNAIGPNGTWIICLLNDLTSEEELVLEGEYKNGKKDDAGQDVIQRKIALYSQDENRTITAKYVLTAPKLTIKSPNASIQHGAFVGDLIVDVDNFQLVDATIDGNLYFTKQEYQDSFTMDEDSSVTGTQGLQK